MKHTHTEWIEIFGGPGDGGLIPNIGNIWRSKQPAIGMQAIYMLTDRSGKRRYEFIRFEKLEEQV